MTRQRLIVSLGVHACINLNDNCFYFQQHSRFRRLSTFIINNIPASPTSFPEGSFVFIDIRASFVQF